MSIQTTLGHAKSNWKTTVQATLGAVIALSLLVTDNPHNPFSFLPPTYTAAIVLAGAIAKILLGLMQTDGQNVQVNLPPNGPPLQVNLPAGAELKQTTSIQTKEP